MSLITDYYLIFCYSLFCSSPAYAFLPVPSPAPRCTYKCVFCDLISGPNSPVFLPFDNTTILSAIAMISFSSDEITIMESPFSTESNDLKDLSLRTDINTYGKAHPEVRSSAWSKSPLPITTFCWFPPDSDRIGKSLCPPL